MSIICEISNIYFQFPAKKHPFIADNLPNNTTDQNQLNNVILFNL